MGLFRLSVALWYSDRNDNKHGDDDDNDNDENER